MNEGDRMNETTTRWRWRISGTRLGDVSQDAVANLADFLNVLGADVRGAGTSRIEMHGAEVFLLFGVVSFLPAVL